MQHAVLCRDENACSPWPVLWRLPDGGIGAGVVTSPVGSHPGASVFGRFLAFVSRDQGRSWEASGDPAHPANWPAATADERMDRFAVILPDGTFVAVGARGFEAWEAGRLEEARSRGRWIREIPERPEWIAVQSPFLCCQRSSDRGRTWERREWEVAGVGGMWCFNRGTLMADGTIVVGVYGIDQEGLQRPYALRSADCGRTWRLHDLCAHAAGVPASEAAICETRAGRLTALVRDDGGGHSPHRGEGTGAGDVGYPVSIQLADGEVLTAYYITPADNVTHSAATIWRP